MVDLLLTGWENLDKLFNLCEPQWPHLGKLTPIQCVLGTRSYYKYLTYIKCFHLYNSFAGETYPRGSWGTRNLSDLLTQPAQESWFCDWNQVSSTSAARLPDEALPAPLE